MSTNRIVVVNNLDNLEVAVLRESDAAILKGDVKVITFCVVIALSNDDSSVKVALLSRDSKDDVVRGGLEVGRGTVLDVEGLSGCNLVRNKELALACRNIVRKRGALSL